MATAPPKAPAQGEVDFLAQVTTGKIKKPQFILAYGPEGVGKSSLAAEAPSPIFHALEDGTDNLEIARLPTAKDFPTVMKHVQQLREKKHEYKTYVADTMDWMEQHIVWPAVCKRHNVNNIEEVMKGFGKGFGEALVEWEQYRRALDALRDERGMNVVLLAHARIKKFEDPTTPTGYERYQVALQDGATYSASKFWKSCVEMVLFMNDVVTVGGADGKARGFGDGTRALFTERRPGFDAKNRINLPDRIVVAAGESWSGLMEAIEFSRSDDPVAIKAQLERLKAQVKNPDLIPKIDGRIKEAGDDVTALQHLVKKLEVTLGQQE